MNRPVPAVVADVVLLTTVSLVALWPLGDAFEGSRWLVAGAVGMAVAIGATLLAQTMRWGPVATVLTTAVGYLLVGPAAAAPHQALGSVVPTLSAERVLVSGVVESWRSVLTVPVPLGISRGELVVPLVITLVGGLIAATLLFRTRFAGFVILPVLAMYLMAAAFGTRDASFPLGRGLLLAVLLLAWLRWRTVQSNRSSWMRRVLLGGVVVGLTGSGAWGIAALAGNSERDVLRDHVDPPLAQLDFKSPLAKYRDYYKNHKNDVLFTFQDLPAGKPLIRLASMDAYDGLVWNVSTTNLRTGSSAFAPPPFTDSGSTVTVTVGKYDGPWVPTVGEVKGALLDRDEGGRGPRELLYNNATGALAMYGNAHAGDVYVVEWTPRAGRTDDLADVAVDRSVPIAEFPFGPVEKLDLLAQRVVSRAGADTDLERAVALEVFFRTGYFNDGDDPVKRDYSPSGHSVRRLLDLAADEKRMIGNDEQYASAMAYAAQRLGIPARVVLGFETVNTGGTVTGDDIAAWVEIPFEGRGWIPFDPTPSETRIPPPQTNDPNPKPQPYVVQPPVLPKEPADVQGVPPEGAGQDLSDRIWDILFRVLGWIWLGIKIALVLSPLWGILLVKRIRRRRRRRAADPVDRLSGAWREITDRARDLGTKVTHGHTRRENGILLAARFPHVDPASLAATADSHVFGPGVPSDEHVASYWADVDTALKRMRRAVPWWRRPIAWFSPASIPWGPAIKGWRGGLGIRGHRVLQLVRRPLRRRASTSAERKTP